MEVAGRESERGVQKGREGGTYFKETKWSCRGDVLRLPTLFIAFFLPLPPKRAVMFISFFFFFYKKISNHFSFLLDFVHHSLLNNHSLLSSSSSPPLLYLYINTHKSLWNLWILCTLFIKIFIPLIYLTILYTFLIY